jgi:hypothetical protein
MSDKELYKIVNGFTKGLLGKRSSESMCFVVTWTLNSFLTCCGIKSKLVEGEIKLKNGYIANHFWIELEDGKVIDPTADQFNSLSEHQMPNIFIGKKPKWYKIIK